METGSVLTETGGSDTTIAPGSYRGDIVLTVAAANLVPWQALTFPFRQGLYISDSGPVLASSVLASVVGGRVTGAGQRSLSMTVHGVATAITPGQSYTGAIVLTAG